MDTFEIVFYILKVIGVLLPIVFYGVKLHKELRDARTRKSEPSVRITVAHLDGMETTVEVSIHKS